MKKLLLSNLLLFIVVGLSAQSFQLMDHNDVNIGGTDHYEYGDASELGLTKFHVKNLTGSTKMFGVKVTLEYVPYTLSDLAICFGTACYSASASVSSTQIVNGGQGENVMSGVTYEELKIAPVTWPWVNSATDSCVWVVTVFDSNNPSDEVSSRIVWRDNTTLTSINDINISKIKLSAYPNPVANNNVTISYSIPNRGELVLYDLVGKQVGSYLLDANKTESKINVSSLKSGVYFYAVKVNGDVLRTERLIIK